MLRRPARAGTPCRAGAGCRSRRARVKRGRTPRNSATSPRPGLRSTITVGRLLSRASSTPQLTATVVVPAPPLAPKNTSVVAGGLARRCAASRRAAVRRTAPWNVSSSRAAARGRTRWRRRASPEGSAPDRPPRRSRRCRRRPRRRAAARSPPSPDDASPRMSTITTIGRGASRWRALVDDADRHGARRSSRSICCLNCLVVADDQTLQLCHGLIRTP